MAQFGRDQFFACKDTDILESTLFPPFLVFKDYWNKKFPMLIQNYNMVNAFSRGVLIGSEVLVYFC